MTADHRQPGEPVGRLAPGTLVAGGRYRVERLLGVWGIRAFYQVEAASLRPRAVLAEFALTGGVAIAERAQRLMALEHPILPAVREYFQQGDVLYLALNLAEGATLDQLLALTPDGQRDEAEVTAWGIELCDGLTYLQSQTPPVAVGDLAPSAIFLTVSDRVKLVGLGHLLGLYTTAGLVGALEPGYTAPEVYLGQFDEHADIYALGALLYRALSGASPSAYAPGSLPPLVALRPAITPELAAIIERAVAQHREARWPDAASFGAALRQAAAVTAARGMLTAPHAPGAGGPDAPVAPPAPGALAGPTTAAPLEGDEPAPLASAATGAPADLASALTSLPVGTLPRDAMAQEESPPAPSGGPTRRLGFFARLMRRRTGSTSTRG
jgi:serine/threonine protein kinase